MSGPGSWLRPPRHVLTLFLGVTGSLSLAMGWLAWQLVTQDRALAAQRTQERLDNASDIAVASVRHGLDDLAQRLEAFFRLAAARAEAQIAEQASMLGDDAVLILAGDRTFDAWPAGRLTFYPVSVLDRHPAAPAVEAFAAGEALEFGNRDLAGALRAFAPLTSSAAPPVRAGALVRSARIWAQLQRPDRALRAYDELAALGTTPAEDVPAGLLARYGRCVVLDDLGRRDDLGREAAALARELEGGAWRLTRAEYEFYRGRARQWLPATAGVTQSASSDPREALSAAVAATWDGALQPGSMTPASGSRLVHADGTTALVVWRSAAGRVAALVGGPRFVDARFVAPGNAALVRYRARMVIADAGLDAPGGDTRQVPPAGAGARLPWSVRIVDIDPGAELAAAAGRRRVVLAGLVALGLFVLAGSAFIVRAVNREIEVSRLQTDFVAAVSHEFRTPLTSIRQVSELLLDGRVPEARREEYYRMQHRDSERLQHLVESLLDFGRMESGAREYRLEPAEVTTLVRAVADEFSAEVTAAGYTVEAALESDGAVVSADRDALGRAIWNLLDNAVKYSPSHKTVWLTTTVRGSTVEIAIRDRGVGVPIQDQRRIFDKFARGANAAATAAKGTGLGLAMVRHAVTAHGGGVRVESLPGEGSTFTITLPLVGSTSASRSSRWPAS